MFFGLLPDEANHTEAFKELVYSMKDMETIIDVTIRPDASSYGSDAPSAANIGRFVQAIAFFSFAVAPPRSRGTHHQVLNHSSQTSKLHKSYSMTSKQILISTKLSRGPHSPPRVKPKTLTMVERLEAMYYSDMAIMHHLLVCLTSYHPLVVRY